MCVRESRLSRWFNGDHAIALASHTHTSVHASDRTINQCKTVSRSRSDTLGLCNSLLPGGWHRGRGGGPADDDDGSRHLCT